MVCVFVQESVGPQTLRLDHLDSIVVLPSGVGGDVLLLLIVLCDVVVSCSVLHLRHHRSPLSTPELGVTVMSHAGNH